MRIVYDSDFRFNNTSLLCHFNAVFSMAITMPGFMQLKVRELHKIYQLIIGCATFGHSDHI